VCGALEYRVRVVVARVVRDIGEPRVRYLGRVAGRMCPNSIAGGLRHVSLEELQRRDLPFKWNSLHRVTMFAVAALYTAKLTMRMIKQVKDLAKPCFPDDFNSDGFLDIFFCVDTAWTLVWEGTIYMINLSVIFLADNVDDTVLNCLAGEFMTKIDDEIVALYLKNFGINEEAYAAANKRQGGCVGCCVTRVCFFIGFLVGLSYNLIAIITLVVGPICKP